MQIFDYPLNYGGTRTQYSEVADNDYSTSSTTSPILLNIDVTGDGTGTEREFTDIFVKGILTSYSIALTGGNIMNPPPRTIPAEVENDSHEMVSTTVDGFQHDLWRIAGPSMDVKANAQAITLTFTGTLVEVMVLNEVLELTKFSRIDYDNLESGSLDQDLSNNDMYIPALGDTRDKWRVLYTSRHTRPDEGNAVIQTFGTYKQFVCAPEYTRFPERVFPATKIGDVQVRRRFRSKRAPRNVSFVVKES